MGRVNLMTKPNLTQGIIAENTHLKRVAIPLNLLNEHEILIDVQASGMNRADLLQLQGKYPPPKNESPILGLEVSGIIIDKGDKVTQFNIGDNVYSLLGGGGYADYCIADARLTAKIPDNWSFIEAAGLPEALVTAHATVFHEGQLKKDETLLMHGAGSGITSMAIQMAKSHEAFSITTLRNPEFQSKAKALGADLVILHQNNPESLQVIPDESVDVIVDFIGGDYVAEHLRILKLKGKNIQIASMKGGNVSFNLQLLMRKRLTFEGFVLRHQSLSEKIHLFNSAQKMWAESLNNKKLHPVIDKTFPMSNIEEAVAYFQQGGHFGKIILTKD